MSETRLIVVTDRSLATRPLLDVVKACLDGGATTFLLREKDLPREQRLGLAEAMRDLGAFVIAGGTDPLNGEAIHLSAKDERVAAKLTGRSCHSKAEVMASTEDYVTLSPIFLTRSKPGYGPALGTKALASKGNIVALGGIETREQARQCLDAGASGVAVMGAIMRAEDPKTVVKGLLS